MNFAWYSALTNASILSEVDKKKKNKNNFEVPKIRLTVNDQYFQYDEIETDRKCHCVHCENDDSWMRCVFKNVYLLVNDCWTMTNDRRGNNNGRVERFWKQVDLNCQMHYTYLA